MTVSRIMNNIAHCGANALGGALTTVKRDASNIWSKLKVRAARPKNPATRAASSGRMNSLISKFSKRSDNKLYSMVGQYATNSQATKQERDVTEALTKLSTLYTNNTNSSYRPDLRRLDKDIDNAEDIKTLLKERLDDSVNPVTDKQRKILTKALTETEELLKCLNAKKPNLPKAKK